MSIEMAILFPIAGFLTLAFTAGCVAIMIHFLYPRQRGVACAPLASPAIWIEAKTEQASAPDVKSPQPAREFIQIKRVNS